MADDSELVVNFRVESKRRVRVNLCDEGLLATEELLVDLEEFLSWDVEEATACLLLGQPHLSNPGDFASWFGTPQDEYLNEVAP